MLETFKLNCERYYMKCAISQKMNHDSETDNTPHILKKIVFKLFMVLG